MSNASENHQSGENVIPPDLRAVAETLASVRPPAPRLDRDRLMFLAGAASASATAVPIGKLTLPARLAWPAATAALAATSLALSAALFLRPPQDQRIVYVPVEAEQASGQERVAVEPADVDHPRRSPAEAVPIAAPSRPATAVTQHNYVRRRDVALRLGLDALGAPPARGAAREQPTPPYRTLLDALALPPGRESEEAAPSQM